MFHLLYACLHLSAVFGQLVLLSFSSDSGQLEQKLEQAGAARRDLEESTKHNRILEKQMKTMKQEREDMHKVELYSCKETALNEQISCPLLRPVLFKLTSTLSVCHMMSECHAL